MRLLVWTIILCLLVLVCSSVVAQMPDLAWKRGFGGFSSDEIHTVVTDSRGNAYVSGFHGATADIDPGPGVLTYTGVGNFIQQYDSSGTLMWTRHYTGQYPSVFKLQLDPTETWMYVGGSFQGTVDFDPGPGSAPLVGLGTGGNGFLMKMDVSGGFLWARHVVASASGGWVTSLAVDGQDHVLLGGLFYGTADFDPGSGTSVRVSAGGSDAFVGKYDSSGALVWIGSLGAQFTDEVVELDVDPWGNVVSAGKFTQTPDFDPGPGVLNFTAQSGMDGYVQKLSPGGGLIWAGPMGGVSSNCLVRDLDCTASGDVVVVGGYYGTVDFDPGPGSQPMTWEGGLGWDMFLLQLDSAGQYLWSHGIGGTYWDQAYCTTVDAGENVYVGAYFSFTVDFDPGPDSVMATVGYPSEIVVLKFNGAGSFKWAAVAGGSGGDYVNEIALDPDNDLFAVGSFAGVADFDPGPVRDTLIGNGNIDGHIYKLLQCSQRLVVTDSSCGPYLFRNVTYTQSGVYSQILPQPTGCDSILELRLTVLNPTGDTLVLTGCDSMRVNGVDYHQSGQYTQTLTNVAGCDSTLLLEITVHAQGFGTVAAASCDSFSLNGFTYSSPGVYVQQLSTVHGCDSTLELVLTLDTLTAAVQLNGATLMAQNAGASYQWLDCGNGYAVIAGAVGQTFTPLSTGTFAVSVMQGNCVDTSACVGVTVMAGELAQKLGLSVFPNPNHGMAWLDLRGWAGMDVGIALVGVDGQVLGRWEAVGGELVELEWGRVPAGVYVLEAKVDGAVWRRRVVVVD